MTPICGSQRSFVSRSRKPKQLSLLLPIQRHIPLPATHRMQVQMPWLSPIQDCPDDVRWEATFDDVIGKMRRDAKAMGTSKVNRLALARRVLATIGSAT